MPSVPDGKGSHCGQWHDLTSDPPRVTEEHVQLNVKGIDAGVHGKAMNAGDDRTLINIDRNNLKRNNN